MAKKKRKPGRPVKDDKLVLISFRIAPDLYLKLQNEAAQCTTDAGSTMTATQLARRILVQSLKDM